MPGMQGHVYESWANRETQTHILLREGRPRRRDAVADVEIRMSSAPDRADVWAEEDAGWCAANYFNWRTQ